MTGVAAKAGRRPRASRARSALIGATKTLLVTRPFGGFSIDEVTREAGVARGSFYNHFIDLDDLVATTQELVQAELNAAVREAIADSPDAATSMARGMATLMHFGYTSRANARVLMVNGPGAGDPAHPGNEVLTEALRHGIGAGEFALRSVEVGVVVVRGICEFGLSRMIDLHHEFSAVRALTEGMLESMLRAIGVEVARIDPVVAKAMQRCFPAPEAGRRPE